MKVGRSRQITLCDPIDKWCPVVLRWITRRTIRFFTFTFTNMMVSHGSWSSVLWLWVLVFNLFLDLNVWVLFLNVSVLKHWVLNPGLDDCHVHVRQRARVAQWRSRASRSSMWVLSFCVLQSQCSVEARVFEHFRCSYRRGVVSHVWVIRWWYCWSVVVVLLLSARLCGKSATVCDSDVLCVECAEYSIKSITLYVVCVCLVLSIFVCSLLYIRKNLTSVFLADPR